MSMRRGKIPMLTSVIRAVIFDLDGTLLDSKEAIVISFQEAARRMNIEIDEDIVRNLIGIPAREIIKRAALTPLREEEVVRFVHLRREIFKDLWKREVKLYPDVMETLIALRDRGYLLGIASSNNEERLRAMVHFFNLDGLIPVAIGYGKGIRPKPYPDMILKVIEKLGISPQEALYVGDTEQDYISAQRAGTYYIMIDREGHMTWHKTPVIRSLLELLRLLP